MPFEPTAENEIPQELLPIIEGAIYAPTSHNRQNFRIEVSGPESLVLHLDPERIAWHSDPLGRQALIGLGTAVESFSIMANALGHKVNISFDTNCSTITVPDVGEKELNEVSVSFTLTGKAEASSQAMSLASVIKERFTDREPFRTDAIDDAILESLRTTVANLSLITDPEQIRLVADMVREGTSAIVKTDRNFMRELSDTLVTTEEGIATGRGMFAETMGIEDAALSAFKLSMRLPTIKLFSGAIANRQHDSIIGSGAIAVISGEDNPLGWVEAGRQLQRGLLTATLHGLRTYPFAVLVEKPEINAAITDKLQAMIGSEQRPLAVFKMGYPVDPDKRPIKSARMPLSHFLVKSKK